ncbi:chromosome-anchoring protein RacA [Geomicrobium halophilum]|uniref:Chromosome-anchoring protein RacA n=1 Tax=Geomicrobium halophilum TaxID=549000 RepID=A0A841PPF0_9BACL|nr:MerR family transcriptional regulator [Geomicrobium halophilum]MBB6449076.1 chromosome-anchoring protein RacA [Geomicrobium halophilum]
MTTLVKTKSVAETLRVAPKTIQTWVRKYKIPVQTNDRGHYLYDQMAIERLQTVKSTQMPDEIEESDDVKVATLEAEKRMDEILQRLDHLEKMIEKKADEVVSFQLLKHRQELDDVQRSITTIEDHLNELNDATDLTESVEETPKRGKLASMFSFSS